METERFIVLRDGNAGFRSFGPGRGAPGPDLELPGAAATRVPPAPEVEIARISETEARDLARAPDVVDIARAMPIKLIGPVADATDPAAAPAAGTPVAWGVAAVGADASPFDGSGVRVAVLDTGIDANHPAFAGMTLIQRDFTGTSLHDAHGHGTHCAGTVFGRAVDGKRIGVAPGVTEALIGKVLTDQGSGSSDWMFQALNWCSDNGAQVISMSLGFDFPGFAADLIRRGFPEELAASIALEGYRTNLRMFDRLMAMMRARADFNGGTIVVAAAGNESRRGIDPNFEVSVALPGAAEGVVSVGALAQLPQGLGVADFSNVNPVIAAPGVQVVSAQTGGGLVALNGTSMACPHVAGLAALWWQAVQSSNAVPRQVEVVERKLLGSADRAALAPDLRVALRGLGLARAPAAPIV